ncbi:MAG TPA: hypothetical protein VKB49_30915 [Candidatus Sulfotelmatobacter sp.]|nr:hypothetical protein [Candidatus Sulfotelmatobacter sp.]
MKIILLAILCITGILALPTTRLLAQEANSPGGSAQSEKSSTSAAEKGGRAYSGMYSFLKDGEFLQVTVEDGGSVTGYISRYGDGESDKGAFLDQFFKNGKLEGTQLNFTTEIVHGVSFDFRGAFERGNGKNPGDEAYYVLKGTLTQNVTDADKKVTSHSRDVAFKLFPQEGTPAPATRK